MITWGTTMSNESGFKQHVRRSVVVVNSSRHWSGETMEFTKIDMFFVQESGI